MIEEEQKYDINSLITLTLQNKNDFYEFLEYAYLLFKTAEDEEKTERIKKILKDQELYRRINIIQSIKQEPENKINYYNKDYGDELDYDEETEEKIIDIKIELLEYISQLIIMMNEEELIDI